MHLVEKERNNEDVEGKVGCPFQWPVIRMLVRYKGSAGSQPNFCVGLVLDHRVWLIGNTLVGRVSCACLQSQSRCFWSWSHFLVESESLVSPSWSCLAVKSESACTFRVAWLQSWSCCLWGWSHSVVELESFGCGV